jgi:hypothetical protein
LNSSTGGRGPVMGLTRTKDTKTLPLCAFVRIIALCRTLNAPYNPNRVVRNPTVIAHN